LGIPLRGQVLKDMLVDLRVQFRVQKGIVLNFAGIGSNLVL